jgi:hypothetical protein
MKERIFYWIPRVLAILALLFLLMFSFDVFEGNDSIWRKLLGFLIHNIPVLVLAGALVVAWKWEVAGGILFIIFSTAAAIIFTLRTHMIGTVIVISPFFFTGILFLVHYLIFVRHRKSEAV